MLAGNQRLAVDLVKQVVEWRGVLLQLVGTACQEPRADVCSSLLEGYESGELGDGTWEAVLKA